MQNRVYNWKRFWVPREATFSLLDGGYLYPPDSEFGHIYNSRLVTLSALTEVPCLALLGEPGIGKTRTVKAEYDAVKANIEASGGRALWLDLHSFGSDTTLLSSLFGNDTFQSWVAGDHKLHLFLDSLDECRLRIDSVAQLLGDRLQDYPVERLSLRILCRTAEWPALLENGLKELWGKEHFKVYELAPLTRADVVEAAKAGDIAAEPFLEEIGRRNVVPLAIKPVTLKFLLNSYSVRQSFSATQASLYAEGCRLLCLETNESRAASRRTGNLTPEQRMVVAGRIAALTILANRYAIWTGVDANDNPNAADDLALSDLYGGIEQAKGEEFPMTQEAILETLDTGLFSSRGLTRMGWAHQTYAEFLAAWYLAHVQMAPEQIMSLVVSSTDSDCKVVPQLHEVAAWLASMNEDVFREIAKVDPEVLLRSDVRSASEDNRTLLVATMLDQYDREQLLGFGWGAYGAYSKLDHPGLASQLAPYIVDKTKGERVRGIAIDIAETCKLQSLEGDLVDVALDLSEPHAVRVNAAAALSRIASPATKARLKPLITEAEQDSSDPDDELRGAALLALWPGLISADELFAALTLPKKASLSGLYRHFLYELGDRLQNLQPSDIPAALDWLEKSAASTGSHLYSVFESAADAILHLAWQHLDTPGVLDLFARVMFKQLRSTKEVFGDQVAQEEAKRLKVLGAMLPLLPASDMNPIHTLWTGFVGSIDVPWLVKQLQSAQSQEGQASIAKLIGYLAFSCGMREWQAIYEGSQNNEVLAKEFAWVLKGIGISSPEGQAMKKSYLESLERQKELEAQKAEAPDPGKRIAQVLDMCESGDSAKWWILNREMTLEPGTIYYGDQFASDLTSQPGWLNADEQTGARIVEAGRRYLLEHEAHHEEWLGKKVWHWPALAGFRAFRLLLSEAPSALDQLSSEVWQKWASAILAYPTRGTFEEDSPEHQLIVLAYKHAPQQTIDTLLVLIDKENKQYKTLITLYKLRAIWDQRLEKALAPKLKDEKLSASSMGMLLDELLRQKVRDASEYAKSLILLPLPARGVRREKAIVAATRLIMWADDAGWDAVWPALQQSEKFGREIVERVCHSYHGDTYVGTRLSEIQLADLYLWVADRYPHVDDVHPEGYHQVSVRESVGRWRDSLLSALRERGTVESVAQITRIMNVLPHLQDLKFTLEQAKANTRQRTWVPPQPRAILIMAHDKLARLVANGDQLLDVLVESIRRFEARLHGRTPTIGRLWNDVNVGHNKQYRPKDENDLSDELKLHLEEDVKERGIILNREAEVRPGQETDIMVDAVPQAATKADIVGDTITVITEVKCCWNEELFTAMEEQLVNTYLKGSGSRHGLYVVGWYLCDEWNAPKDGRKGDCRRLASDRQELQRKLSDEAKRLSQSGLHIEAIVIDATLIQRRRSASRP